METEREREKDRIRENKGGNKIHKTSKFRPEN